ncbi:MAG: transposase family protein [Puniceicoccales bacterium]|jgi:hypothetical protein|nr:transposase family protein [Puniceicoccales bacterium]
MQILERMFRNERTMKAVFGLGSEKFDELAGRMEILYIEKLASRKDRERAVGAGRKSLIPTGRHKLAFILFYLKVCPSFDVLGIFSGINSAECCRWVHKLLPILEQLLGQKQLLPKRKIRSLEEFAAAFPQAVEVMIDATERPTQRRKKNDPAQTLLREKEETHTQGDCHCGCKTLDRVSFSEQTAEPATTSVCSTKDR